MSLEQVYKKLSSEQKTAAAVADRSGEIQGIISLDGISRYFMIETAINRTEP
jgi:hypothetical protein